MSSYTPITYINFITFGIAVPKESKDVFNVFYLSFAREQVELNV